MNRVRLAAERRNLPKVATSARWILAWEFARGRSGALHRIWGILSAMAIIIASTFASSLEADDSDGKHPNPTAAATEAEIFRNEVLPVLQQHCYQCHSHESRVLQGGLALDYRSGWERGGDSGPAVLPGDPKLSLLTQAIRHEGGLEMPPDAALKAEQIAVLERWVESGAFDDRVAEPVAAESDWWSLRELVRPPLPQIRNGAISTNATAIGSVPAMDESQIADGPIDTFVQAQLDVHGLHFSPQADRRTLIRRLSMDLLGLLPSDAQVDEFERDVAPGAYDRLVDRMLASVAYGERWTRHWMDTIHFADTHGFEHDVARPNAWPYRDYLIERLNEDIPWSRFIREQLAADHCFPEEPQWTAALGFLGAGSFDISSFTTAPMAFAYLDRDDMVTQTMSAFASSTVNCARCHAHKFDPISQDDYFAIQAVFAGVVKGDIAYDRDFAVALQRQKWEALLKAASETSAEVLLSDAWTEAVAQFETAWQPDADLWRVAHIASFQCSEGGTLRKLDDQSLLAGSPYPEKATYRVQIAPATSRVTALRIEAMTHESLPAGGPGTAANGNLHLSTIEAFEIGPGEAMPRALALTAATADFEQEGWTAAHAIDASPDTAWGIHPHEGKSHAIAVQLVQPFDLPAGHSIEIVLHQLHGRGHVLGRIRLSTSDQATARLTVQPEAVLAALRTTKGERTTDQHLAIAAAALRSLAEGELAKLPVEQKVYAASSSVLGGNGITAQSIAKPAAVHVLSRGDLGSPLRPAAPGALAVVTALSARFEIDPAEDESARRAALADWLADSKNPLTWRSIANRVWQFHFGRGLCDTPSDFGRMGGAVTHPELLEWLACELRDGDQSLKSLHRSIVTSRTYRQRSDADPQSMAIDAENLWLSRQNRNRMDADSFRDAVLAASGGMDRTMGGPAIQHFSTSPGAQLTPIVDYSTFDWNAPNAQRRSIYRFVWRGIPDPLMEALDFPDLGLLTPRRAQSTSALQSLAMYNNDFVLTHAQRLADRLATPSLTTSTPSIDQQLSAAFRATLQREPSQGELALFIPLANRHGLALVCRVLMNSNEFLFLD